MKLVSEHRFFSFMVSFHCPMVGKGAFPLPLVVEMSYVSKSVVTAPYISFFLSLRLGDRDSEGENV